ncbi:MAG: nucleoside triphosphate pyrophosphohydrolase [Ignavibacteria bacterium GWB2_35_12]|nr:MAG: nucleoside triphosphate pyrophosphohydrolase [Ignavibacteria bacterium GWA2_35_8]OGU38924.1 MAG: nucleoside triphosphate pyrophosphohydrolase [Ignavibacteria bacterium GWB2_35_12]OGU88414.1 MAG: nucleoside triphosphate pyrophosphohydrolase [Ignavibacteria bacterium RIFOXYA2_FULL_35_10]OGV20402.1 MAG: nucleoside triphosphate pyrophosphohydrolase [Ignavibacteria bacterium RIFOXYC2_FULL_35_21]
MSEKIEIPQAKNPDDINEQFGVLVDIIKILRKECPWDRNQTNESIAHLMIEETYETIEAINNKDDKEFSKELGDLLLHVIMHSVMAEERNAFGIIDVIKKIQKKLIHRHPHVFGDVEVSGEKDVLRNWENLKLQEGRDSILDGVPPTLPALLRAQRVQFKASKVGFDWNKKQEAWKKIDEELAELKYELEQNNHKKAQEELGDILFSIVNASRFEDVVAEEALQNSSNKFIRRFKYIEVKAAEQGRLLSDMTLAEMDALWDEAKSKENTE